MIPLFSIFCQWFSRGCLLDCCLKQDKWEMLLIAFLIGIAVGSPFQGYMSDKSSRKRLLLVTILCVTASMLIVVLGDSFLSNEDFPISLIVASVLNGVFGNVFPVAAAAYSEKNGDFRKALQASFLCRYSALGLPFILRLPYFYGFLVALTINLASLIIVIFKFEDKVLEKE